MTAAQVDPANPVLSEIPDGMAAMVPMVFQVFPAQADSQARKFNSFSTN
jgi:hypothetical protein